ncbi:MAG: helix-turn-helix domain-containing protein [Actinomycetota bacterium]|nr:helix-turn-helix domain-containing protein [Actinomycetota bacterium]
MTGLSVELPEGALEMLAAAVAQRLLNQDDAGTASPWLTAQEAAEYLRCPISRIRKLSMLGAIPKHREGGRVLFHRKDLDEFVWAGGSTAT